MSTAPLGARTACLARGSLRRRLLISGSALSAIAAFAVPIASTSSLSASPADPTTTTVATTRTTPWTMSSPTTETPVTEQRVVVIGANQPGNTIIATGSFTEQATDAILPRTGSSSTPAALIGLAFIVAGALAATLTKRRHRDLG